MTTEHLLLISSNVCIGNSSRATSEVTPARDKHRKNKQDRMRPGIPSSEYNTGILEKIKKRTEKKKTKNKLNRPFEYTYVDSMEEIEITCFDG